MGSNAWPVGTGHPCFGCTEKGVGFTKPIHQQATVFTVTPPATYPNIVEEKTTGGWTIGGAALAGAAAGAAVTAGIKIAKNLGENESKEEEKPEKEET